MSSPRAEQLRTLLKKQPADAFLHYALALELKKLGDLAGALSSLAKTADCEPNYLYAYYQQGQIHEQLGDPAAAVIAYDEGINRARVIGDAKALGELQAARDLLD